MASGNRLTIFDMVKNVDGSGSGLDADKLDGLDSTQFIRSDVDDTVNGALTFGQSSNYLNSRPIRVFGQYYDNKIFYVDPENGDDDNNGSYSSPFKTLKKAFNDTPYGTKSTVYIMKDIELKSSEGAIYSTFKYIELRSHPDNEDAKLIINFDTSGTPPIKNYFGAILYLKIDIEVVNNHSTSNRYSAINVDSQCFIRTYSNYGKTINAGSNVNCTFTLNDNTYLVYNRNSHLGFEYADFNISDTNAYMFYIGYQSRFYISSNCTINSNSITQDLVKPYVGGLLYDKNTGQAINITSNYNFNKKLIFGVGGDGYKWVDETDNRDFDTTYTNTTGKPIQLIIRTDSASGTYNTSYVNVDGVTVSYFGHYDGDSSEHSVLHSVIIPSNNTYELKRDNTNVNLSSWFELK